MPSNNSPTTPRERIIRFDGNLCVTAGAGAGKTTCLVDTYLGLLRGREGRPGLKPDQIAAITFTEKAAAEMLGRVVSEIRQANDPRLEALLPDLEWAPISTIHAFALSLLREYGPLLGLDPDFRVADEEDFSDLLGQTAQDWLRSRLAAKDPALDGLLAQYSLNTGYGLPGKMIWLYHQLATMGLSPDLAARASDQAHQEELARGGELIKELGQLVNVLGLAVADGLVNLKVAYGRTIQGLLDAWPELGQALAPDPPPMSAIEELFERTKGNWQKVKDIRNEFRKIHDELIRRRALPACRELTRDLFSLVQGFSEKMAEEMRRRSLVSFDQILLGALDLLTGHPGVLAELRGRFQALLVDEFQDVNPVQGRLVNLLAGLEQPSPEGQPKPRLLLVGDRKQSIYAFRGAEVVLYSQTMADFADQGALVALPENFRSIQELVSFFNRSFKYIFQAEEEEEPDPRRVIFLEEDIQIPGGNRPAIDAQPVEVLDCRVLAPEGEKLKVSSWRSLESQAVAGRVVTLLESGRALGDIVLLFRRLTQVQVYEEALARAGLASYTVRGSGFYACQEVRDLACALSALLNPQDVVALLGLLRSPLVGLSDEALLALTWPNPDQTRSLANALFSRANLPDWLGEEQVERWNQAQEMIFRLSPLSRRMKPAELIEELLADSDMLPVHLGGPGGEQRMANLRKLLETAREPAYTRPGGMEGFVRRLRDLVVWPSQDPQAPLAGETAQVVRLMTVHQAKGLQFPVVILADLGGRIGGGSGDPPPGPGGVISIKAREASTGENLASPIYKRLQAWQQAGEKAEATRLFYVACTRARDRLIFALSGKNDNGTWGEWVEKLVVDDPAARVIPADSLPAAGHTKAQAPVQEWPDALPPEPGPRADQGRALLDRVVGHDEPQTRKRIRESVTGLGNWLDCPRKYLYTRRLGLDTAEVMALAGRGKQSQAGIEGGAVALGSLVHSALEVMDFAAGPDGVEQAVGLALARDGFDKSMSQAAIKVLGHFWNTDLAKYLLDEPHPLDFREQGFRLNLPGDDAAVSLELIGQMDLALVWPDGRSLVVDYKVTDKLDIKKYVYQLGLYALAMSKVLPSAGQAPGTAICVLNQKGAELVGHSFSDQDLAFWEQEALRAAQGMAGIRADTDPRSLEPPVPERCNECVLASLCGK